MKPGVVEWGIRYADCTTQSPLNLQEVEFRRSYISTRVEVQPQFSTNAYILCVFSVLRQLGTIAFVILKSSKLELLLPIGRESMDVSLRAAMLPRL